MALFLPVPEVSRVLGQRHVAACAPDLWPVTEDVGPNDAVADLADDLWPVSDARLRRTSHVAVTRLDVSGPGACRKGEHRRSRA